MMVQHQSPPIWFRELNAGDLVQFKDLESLKTVATFNITRLDILKRAGKLVKVTGIYNKPDHRSVDLEWGDGWTWPWWMFERCYPKKK